MVHTCNPSTRKGPEFEASPDSMIRTCPTHTKKSLGGQCSIIESKESSSWVESTWLKKA